MIVIDWTHALIEIVGGSIASTIPIILYLAANKRTAKLENAKRHEENTLTLKQIKDEMDFLPLHSHNERTGPLTAEGIVRRPNNRN